MPRKLASIIMLSLLIVSALALAFNVQPVKSDYAWTETIYIQADGSIQPPAAPISSVDNVTYTLTDNITGDVPALSTAIIIQRDNIVLDGGGCTLQGIRGGNGIYLSGISNVTIKNMKITAFKYGVWLDSSSNNSISGNNITANNATGVWLYSSSSNNSVSGNNITNNEAGVLLYFSSNNSVSGNNITANYDYGVYVDSSSNNSISRNNITANYWVNICLSNHSNNNSVSGNKITATNGYGIDLDESSNNSVSGNNITNNEYGVRLCHPCNNNSISGNNITANKVIGIRLDYYSSSNNSISGNNITNNGCGIWLYYSSNNNTIYHNNFINNTRQVSSGSTNVWDDGYPSGGNYWSDYTGVDANGDGRGDTPYVIDADNQDRYPLMQPWSPRPAFVDISPDMLNLKGKGEWVTAYVELPEGYNVADVSISTMLLNYTVSAELSPTAIGDHDGDGVPDLMVNFNRTTVSQFILSEGIMVGNVTFTITGQLHDGTWFEGSDIIRVRMPGDVNSDGKVNMIDLYTAARAFGALPTDPRWDPVADENEDGKIDMQDLFLIARNFGKTYP